MLKSILFVVFILGLVASSSAISCEETNCPRGVGIVASYSEPGCTGTRTLQAVYNYTFCERSGVVAPRATSYSCTASGGLVTRTFDGSSCSASKPYVTDTQEVDRCVDNAVGSSAYWCDIQDLKTPKPPVGSVDRRARIPAQILNGQTPYELCNSPSNCPNNYPLLYLYGESNCQGPVLHAQLMNFEAFYAIGVCYVQNATTDRIDDSYNFQYSCNANFLTLDQYSNGCKDSSSRYYRIQYGNGACSRYNETVWVKSVCRPNSATSLLSTSTLGLAATFVLFSAFTFLL